MRCMDTRAMVSIVNEHSLSGARWRKMFLNVILFWCCLHDVQAAMANARTFQLT